jgi:peptidoglycan/LPS O-acetylase OafA/YrhL
LAGLLLSRICKPTGNFKHAFLWCSLFIIIIFSIPRIGGEKYLWANGLYDSLSIIFLFPLVVYWGASGKITNKTTLKICNFFGDISYPIYIIHYPLIYIFTAWVVDNQVPMSQAWPIGLLLLIGSIAIAYACLKWYDVPLRKWLAKKLLKKG